MARNALQKAIGDADVDALYGVLKSKTEVPHKTYPSHLLVDYTLEGGRALGCEINYYVTTWWEPVPRAYVNYLIR